MKRFLTRTMTLLLLMLGAAEATKPNMVIYLADDHGRLDCSVYGNPSIKTPTLEKLAAEGMVFNNAFVASPSCGPSRSALITGLMPARNGAEPNHARPRAETITMVKLLQQQGYEVVAFGKVAHSGHSRLPGFDITKSGRREKLADHVRELLKDRPKDQPLCLLVGDNRPHVSWITESIYDPDTVKLPFYLVNTKETREHWARYMTDVTGMDAQMGEVDQMARDYFGSDDYIFMYTSDHGGQWPFGKWNLYDTGTGTPLLIRWPGKIQAGVRTDAMVSWIDLFPTLIDLAGGTVPADIDGKSFADVLLGKKKEHRDVIYTTHSGASNNVYPIRSVRTKRFKYIRNLLPDCYHSNQSCVSRKDGAGAYWHSWDEAAKTDPKAAAIVAKYHQRPAVEFFDLENDPAEQNNLAGNPEYKAKIDEMSAMLDAWMTEQGDQQTIYGEPYPLSGPTPYLVEQSKGGAKNKNGKRINGERKKK